LTAPRIIRVWLPIRIRSEGNVRQGWRAVAHRKKQHRDEVFLVVGAHQRQLELEPPLRVTLIRIGPRDLDSDNLVAGFKFVRDGVALAVGIDDGDRERIRWRYGQRRSGATAAALCPWKYAVEITVERAR